MSAQPLNTEISIYRAARSQRSTGFNTDAIAVFIKRLRGLVMVIPGYEVMCGVLTRDANSKDFSPYCGQAAAGANRGFPIVFGLLPTVSFAEAAMNVDQINFPYVIGQDQFLYNTTAGLAGDLYANLRNLITVGTGPAPASNPTGYGTFTAPSTVQGTGQVIGPL